MRLRSPQQKALAASKKAMEQGVLRQVIVAATSFGKTVCFANLAEHHGLTGRILVLVNQEELAKQAADKIRRWNPGVSVGVEMADSYALPTDQYVVASVQTLSHTGGKRLAAFDPATFSAVIVDECHVSISPSFRLVLGHFGLLDGNPHSILLTGWTATPKRSDNQALAPIYDEIVYVYDLLRGINEGYLAPPRAYIVKTQTSLDGVPIRAGDFAVGELSRTINNPMRNKGIVKAWLEYGEDRQTLVFCADIDHAKDMAVEFCRAGVKAEAVWGSDPEREAKIGRLRSGVTKVLTNCMVLSVGFDCWQVACVVNAASTKSELVYIQRVGRGGRLPDGIDNLIEARKAGLHIAKEDYIVIDVHDSTRHSLMSIPSIFGLPPKMDLRGAKLTEAIKKVEEVSLQHPSTDLAECADFSSIDTYVEQVDLFKVHFSDEVMANSELAWFKTPDGGYRLLLPNRESVNIKPDLLGWHIAGTVEGASFEGREQSMEDSFHFADAMITRLGRRLMNMLRRESKAKWAKDEITTKQKNYLSAMLRMRGKPLPDWSKMRKAEAVLLLSKLRNDNWGAGKEVKL